VLPVLLSISPHAWKSDIPSSRLASRRAKCPVAAMPGAPSDKPKSGLVKEHPLSELQQAQRMLRVCTRTHSSRAARSRQDLVGRIFGPPVWSALSGVALYFSLGNDKHIGDFECLHPLLYDELSDASSGDAEKLSRLFY